MCARPERGTVKTERHAHVVVVQRPVRNSAPQSEVLHVLGTVGQHHVAGPLRIPLLVRFAHGSVITSDAISLDAMEAAARGFDGRGEVRSVIPVWRDAA